MMKERVKELELEVFIIKIEIIINQNLIVIEIKNYMIFLL